MSISLMQQGRPPYIRFEQRAEEDRAATIAANRMVLKDVDYVVIHPPGSKDFVEKVATEWLDDCDRKANKSPPEYPIEWANAWHKKYDDWKAGLEVTPLGFSVRQWPAISKAQAENLVLAGVLTVEDLAVANEQVLARVGMGGRALKEKAQAWMESAKGNVGEELAALRAQLNDAVQTIQDQAQKISRLESTQVPQALESRKRA